MRRSARLTLAILGDKRSGIVSDPNNLNDEEYIVRLVGRVVTVSVETVKLVEELAREVTQEDWLVETTDTSVIPSLAESID